MIAISVDSVEWFTNASYEVSSLNTLVSLFLITMYMKFQSDSLRPILKPQNTSLSPLSRRGRHCS